MTGFLQSVWLNELGRHQSGQALCQDLSSLWIDGRL